MLIGAGSVYDARLPPRLRTRSTRFFAFVNGADSVSEELLESPDDSMTAASPTT